jgi:hypothetical protein
MTERKHFIEVGPGFYNMKGSFTFLGGLVDIGTQMSLVRLNSGKFLVIDTCGLSADAKQEIDDLTDGGTLIEAVIATHPFHTMFFAPFYEFYKTPRYYGCPRHLRNIKAVPWTGNLIDVEVRQLWEPEVSMRIPDGGEFDNPPENIHFSSVFLYHRASKVIHVDDTINYFDKEHTGWTLSTLFWLLGVRTGRLSFHPTITSGGLYNTPEAPWQFKAWVEKLLQDWDFDTICAAHCGTMRGGAKDALAKTLKHYEKTFEDIAEKNKSKTTK